MGWTFFWMMIVLKVPIVALLAIVWWAIRQEPETSGEDPAERIRKRPHPPGWRPGRPRRGPHGDPAPLPPPRVRTTVARGRDSERA